MLIWAAAGGLLALFVSALTAPQPRTPSPAEGEAVICLADGIQSLDSWTLARLQRGPVAAPRKGLWERALGNPQAVQTAIRDRLAGWPSLALADRAALPRDLDAFARRLAEDTWRGLEALTDREHGLPLDTVSFGAASVAAEHSHAADYTSTTNIGMHVIGVVAAHGLGLIDARAAEDRIRLTLATLSRLETDGGLFFNYYDTTSLERTSRFVSFVDSGWLAAGLMVARMAFPNLYEHCTALLERMNFNAFYDRGSDLFSHGYFVEPRGPSPYHYGVLYTEARLGALIAIGKGEAPESVWFSMIRTFPAGCRWQRRTPEGVREKSVLGYSVTAGYYEWEGMRYVPSWGGSMFEALMPALVLDEAAVAPKSLGANGRAHARAQRRFALRQLDLPVWGFSPSATPGSARYGEYGVALLGSLGYPSGPVTPHASALAMVEMPRAALANLRRLAGRYEIYGQYGFYDAVDARTGQVAYKYLALDQSMILIALANHLAGGVVQRHFAADPIIQRILPLIAAEDFFD